MLGIDNVQIENDPFDVEDSRKGAIYGVTAGVDLVSSGGFFAGAELEFSDANTDDEVSDMFVDGDKLRLSSGRDLYAGARF
ncbi:hypothetical protein [Croceicoccus sp. YJ47]|uniref:hypothetical protein n=1 Tax=Croceicoccus sp. YJ47 TaxID=2798724 RepID=UPI0019230231|nr:hypothetical protein [Croceicoccus sp. YJ47]QQN74381.1 hypothetical protein JD971_00810 [Croceicoccus sp. YJ47]